MTAMSEVRIELLDESGTPALEKFLQENTKATVFHTLNWHRVIQETYGHKCDYWVAWSGQHIAGIFPVVAVRHPLFGAKMVAMAYQMHSGLPLATSEILSVELVKRALARAHEVGAKYFEIRHYEPTAFLEKLGFTSVDSQLVNTTTPLKGLALRQMRKGHRTEVGYASKRGVEIIESHALSDLRIFRHMFLIESRRIGSPQAGWNFFENLHCLAGDYYRLLLAKLGDRCIGGVLTLDNRNVVFLRYVVYTSPEALKLKINKALVWKAMSSAAQRGVRSFNLGISWYQDTGLIYWKEAWNGITHPVYIYVYPIRSKAPVPGKYFEGFTLAKALWRRLPLPVVDFMGQMVTRWVC